MQVKELRSEMVKKDITQKDIAKLLNKTEATICKYFDLGDMPLADAVKISKELNLSNTRSAEVFLN